MAARPENLFDATRLSRRGFLTAAVGVGAGAALAACGGGGSGSGTTTIRALHQQQAGYSASDIQGMTTAFMKANPTIKVENTLVAYEALHDKIVAAAPAGTYDVVLMDCIWPAEFAKKHVVADISDKVKALSGLSGIFPGAIQTAQYEGKYYGMPWLLDTKYLFYNTEMLQKAGIKPEQLATWDGVKSAAQALKAKNIVKYPLIGSWAQAEAVVCDYAALVGAFGGSFLDAAGKPAFTSGGGLQALQFMRDLISSGLANPASAESIEDDVVKTFSQGNAAIALNWTFMYGQANDPKASKVAGKVGMLRTPAGPGGKAPGVNGASALAITSGSQHQDAAWEYVKYLTSQSVQDKFATSSLPIWKASYDEPAVQKAGTPAVVSVAKTQLQDMILRPQVPNYNAASQQLQVDIQKALLGHQDPAAALTEAAHAFTASN
ncbi:extracellular solute-binding protein [Fodinicola feengrottensis]|uniref:Extracellular solute-binding protein n=1 Tax=Fodinicola feengrottensis TaxID=435914 RepID=A0ABN2FZC4_9ACTN